MLFIPEANNATNPQGPANAFYSFGELDSLGFSPFSIESLPRCAECVVAVV